MFWQAAYERRRPVEIPPITCLADFESYQPARDPAQHASALAIVWFQDNFAMPIQPTIEKQIQGIDWDKVANDFGW
jgi:hypothetical protein